MLVLTRLRRLLVQNFLELRFHTFMSVLLFYFAASWLLLWLSGEQELTTWPDFFYWIVVTASTVGYGDLSPTTNSGRWVVSLLVIPLGLSLFALTIGRVAAFTSEQWKKGVRGLKTLETTGHILVLGWHGQRTLHLLKLLLFERGEQTAPQIARGNRRAPSQRGWN